MYLLGKTKPILTSKPIGEYQDMLSHEAFFRVHRSHLINLKYVVRYTRGDGSLAIMSDDTQVEVSRRKKNEFVEALSKL